MDNGGNHITLGVFILVGTLKIVIQQFFLFFFFKIFLMWTILKFIYLFIYGCVGSSFLCEGFL